MVQEPGMVITYEGLTDQKLPSTDSFLMFQISGFDVRRSAIFAGGKDSRTYTEIHRRQREKQRNKK